jgi:hypothetical protein
MTDTAGITPEQDTSAQEPKKEKTLGETLREFPGAPDDNQIEKWKQEYGEIFCSGLSATELVIFRPINRAEFSEMQLALAQTEKAVTQLDVEQQIVQTCTLWLTPAAKAALSTKAGSATTLHEQIMFNSNFMDPRVAQALVIKL